MPRHTKDLIAFSLFEASHNADTMFTRDHYLEWVIVYPQWEPNDGKLLIHKSGLVVFLDNYDSLKEAKKVLQQRADRYNSFLDE